MISITCPKCSAAMEVPDSLAGSTETCPVCGNVCTVPVRAVVATPTVPAPAPLPAAAALSQVNVNVQAPPAAKSTNGLGVAALVLGIVAVLTCWIPFIGILGIPLAVLGCVFGLIGLLIALIGRRSGVGMPIAGLIICIVSIVIAVSMTGGAAVAIDEAIREAEARPAPAAAPPARNSSNRGL